MPIIVDRYEGPKGGPGMQELSIPAAMLAAMIPDSSFLAQPGDIVWRAYRTCAVIRSWGRGSGNKLKP